LPFPSIFETKILESVKKRPVAFFDFKSDGKENKGYASKITATNKLNSLKSTT
jgi:hypothetical protein